MPRLTIRRSMSATAMHRIHGCCIVAWMCLIPVAFWTGWIDSVRFVSTISLVALVIAQLGPLQGARVEVKQEESEG